MLVDAHDAVPGGALAKLCRLLRRVEDLSHILIWANEAEAIEVIELPRLKLRLAPRGERPEC